MRLLPIPASLPGLGEASELVVAPHQRREPALAGDLEAADGSGGAQDAVHADEP
jgi:hypothetical protein